MITVIEMKGKTQKGKNRIRENGSIWQILFEYPKVMCLDNQPGYFVSTVPFSEKASRWIKKEHDENFEFKVVSFLEENSASPRAG